MESSTQLSRLGKLTDSIQLRPPNHLRLVSNQNRVFLPCLLDLRSYTVYASLLLKLTKIPLSRNTH